MAQANSPSENVRALQRALYVAAKRNGGRKFPALLDRIARPDVLRDAWEQVRRNQGAAGIDGETLAAVEAYGVERMLGELRELLLAGRYRPQPSRRVLIPKPGRPGEERPLSIPRVRDRVAQTAAKLVLEAIFEASFLPTSFGFRPKRSAHQALELIGKEVNLGARWVVDLDFKDYLETSSHYPLVSSSGSKRLRRAPWGASGSSMRRPLRRPERRCMACSSPRFTRCNTVCRETSSAFIASHMVTQPGGASSTNWERRSSVMRMRQGAPGVNC